MKDFSLDIIKDNTYFIKSPCDGEIIRFFVNKNENIKEKQPIAIIKKNNAYIEIESDFEGRILEICFNVDDEVSKWDDIVIVDVTSQENVTLDSAEYSLIYNFQQEILPKLIYTKTEMFLEGIDHEKGNFIHFLLNEVFKNNNSNIPFTSEDFNVIEEIYSDKILLIAICWPQVDRALFTRRSYILIDAVYKKIQYFTCENTLSGEVVISCIVPIRGNLTRYNYGVAPEGIDDEKRKIMKIFIG